MMNTRYEQYNHRNKLPFIIHIDLERSPFKYSKEKNWHEDLEIELCTKGNGTVLLNGEPHSFEENDIAVINSNIIHYTGTDSSLTYTCIIISAEFCTQMGINYNELSFTPIIRSKKLVTLINNLKSLYIDNNLDFETPKLNSILLQILIELAEHHATGNSIITENNKAFESNYTPIKFFN